MHRYGALDLDGVKDLTETQIVGLIEAMTFATNPKESKSFQATPESDLRQWAKGMSGKGLG